MSRLRTNILANLIGGAWIAALTVIITPLQVHLLGIEAYAIVGLIAILQVVIGTLDLGLSATVTRAVSADHSPNLADSHDLVNSVGTFYWAVSLAIAAALWMGSPWVATHWLKPNSLDPSTVRLAIELIAIYLALRWPVAFYSGLIVGLQKMTVLNSIKSAAAAVRLLGGVIVLLILPTLTAFLLWFAASAGLELLAFAVAAHRLMPGLHPRPQFSTQALRKIFKFSLSMNGIALLSMLLTQIDRLIVSDRLSLEALGYYSLAYNTVIGVSLIQTAINSASLPAFARSFGAGNTQELLARYNKTSQLMGYVIALPCLVLGFFGHEILSLWISPQAADGAAPALAILSIGFFFNAVVSKPYIVSVASNRPDLSLKVNLLGLTLYVPALYLLIDAYGILGAATCWAGLNIYYMATLLPWVQIGLLGQKVKPWLVGNVLPFLLFGMLSFGAMKFIATKWPSAWAGWLIIAAIAYAALAYTQLSSSLKTDLRGFAAKLYPSFLRGTT